MKNWHITIIQALNGPDAIEIYENQKDIDLVFMDLRLPKMDGIQTMLKLKKINPNVKVVAQSAAANRDDTDKYIALGFEDLLGKPIDEDRLMDLLSRN